MFDFGWSEIAVIAVVALVLIGPKDMPVALKGVTDMIKKARRMAGEFQGHVDEMMREANLGEVREQFNEIRSFNIKGMVERAVDTDGTLRRTFTGNPLNPDPVAPTTVAAPPPVVTPPPAPGGPAPNLTAAGITPPPVPVRAGASPFEVTMPTVGALNFPSPPKREHPPFKPDFGPPVTPPPVTPPPVTTPPVTTPPVTTPGAAPAFVPPAAVLPPDVAAPETAGRA